MTEFRSCYLHGDFAADAGPDGLCPGCAAERGPQAPDSSTSRPDSSGPYPLRDGPETAWVKRPPSATRQTRYATREAALAALRAGGECPTDGGPCEGQGTDAACDAAERGPLPDEMLAAISAAP